MMSLATDIGLALTDCFSVTGTSFTWNGRPYSCILNADQNVLVTSKNLFATNQIPSVGDVIYLAGKDRQITGRANAAEQFVPGGLSSETTFVDDPSNPSLALQFSSFIGT